MVVAPADRTVIRPAIASCLGIAGVQITRGVSHYLEDARLTCMEDTMAPVTDLDDAGAAPDVMCVH